MDPHAAQPTKPVDGTLEQTPTQAADAAWASDETRPYHPTDPTDPAVPARIGRYGIERVLGRGGMGLVYLGRDPLLGRLVAVKVIAPRDPRWSDGTRRLGHMRAAFLDEARIGTQLNHPAIATVFDFGFHADAPYIVFEYVGGETLDQTIARRGPVPLDEVRLVVAPLAQALHFAHARQVVHRDLKPANIRATEFGLYKILDLGLAREFREDQDWSFAGTPRYASPEQAAGDPCDGRTDQYALALIVFELLTGRRGFEVSGVESVLRAHREQTPPPLRELRPDLPESVEQAVARALAKNPNDRFPTCEAFAAALGCQFLTDAAAADVLKTGWAERVAGRLWTRLAWYHKSGRRVPLALTADALWMARHLGVERVPLAGLTVARSGRRWVRLTAPAGRLDLRFRSRAAADGWAAAVGAGAAAPAAPAAPPDANRVVTVPSAAGVRHQTLGAVECTAADRRLAALGVQVRAALLGADAVVDGGETHLPGDPHRWRRAGTAVRAADAAGRRDLAGLWYAARLRVVGRRLTWLLVVLAVGRLLVTAVTSALAQGAGPLRDMPGAVTAPAGADRWAYLAEAAGTFAVVQLVPLGLLLAARYTARPGLLRPALAAAAGMIYLPFLAYVVMTLPELFAADGSRVGGVRRLFAAAGLFDPFQLGLFLAGAVLLRSGLQLDREARARLRSADPVRPRVRPATAVVWAVAVGYVGWLAVFGVVAAVTHRPGRPDPVSVELEAAVARYQDGFRLATSDPRAAAERFAEAIRLFSRVPPAHPSYDQAQQYLFHARSSLGYCQMARGDVAGMANTARAALAQFDQLPPGVRSDPDIRCSAAGCHSLLAAAAMAARRPAEAEAECRAALTRMAGLTGTDRVDHVRQDVRFRLVMAVWEAGRAADAVAACRDGIAGFDRMSAVGRADPELRRQHGTLHTILARGLAAADRPAADRAWAEGVRLLEQLAADFPTDPTVRAALLFAREPLPGAMPGL